MINSTTDGRMTWDSAQAWIASLNTSNYLGVAGWRLPVVHPVNGSAFNYSLAYDGSTDYGYNISEQGTAFAGSAASEMAHLFYNTLNNKGVCDPVSSTTTDCVHQSGAGLTNTGPFSNIKTGASSYWSGTEYAPNTTWAWGFSFQSGGQGEDLSKSYNHYAWAVLDGNIAPVPTPAAISLFASALGLLAWVRRRAAA